MLKKLFLVLALVLTIICVGNLYAFEDKETCTLIEGAKVVQVLPDNTLRGIIVPESIEINIGPEIPQNVKDIIQGQLSGGMDWSEAHIGMIQVDFGAGPIPLILIIKEIDVRDCH